MHITDLFKYTDIEIKEMYPKPWTLQQDGRVTDKFGRNVPFKTYMELQVMRATGVEMCEKDELEN